MPKRWTEILVSIAICACLAALLLPPTRHPGHDRSRDACRDNLRQIALALHNDHEDYHCFPPAHVADADPVYHCRSDAPDDESAPRNTSYLAIVGQHTCWQGDEPASFDQIADDPAETLLVVECAASGIHWMAPRDLHVEQMALTVNPAFGQCVQSLHEAGAHVVFADGHASFLREGLDPTFVRKLIERDDGEEVGDF